MLGTSLFQKHTHTLTNTTLLYSTPVFATPHPLNVQPLVNSFFLSSSHSLPSPPPFRLHVVTENGCAILPCLGLPCHNNQSVIHKLCNSSLPSLTLFFSLSLPPFPPCRRPELPIQSLRSRADLPFSRVSIFFFFLQPASVSRNLRTHLSPSSA